MSLAIRHQAASPTVPMSARQGKRQFWSGRPTVNLTSFERAGRIVIGLAAILVGAQLHTAASWPLTASLEILLFAAGLDLYLTGALGISPLYYTLGYTPKSLKEMS